MLLCNNHLEKDKEKKEKKKYSRNAWDEWEKVNENADFYTF